MNNLSDSIGFSAFAWFGNSLESINLKLNEFKDIIPLLLFSDSTVTKLLLKCSFVVKFQYGIKSLLSSFTSIIVLKEISFFSKDVIFIF